MKSPSLIRVGTIDRGSGVVDVTGMGSDGVFTAFEASSCIVVV